MIEKFLAWSRGVFRRPGLVVTGAVLLTILFSVGMLHLQIDNNIEHMIPVNTPARLLFHHYEEVFGSSDFIFIGVQSGNTYSPEILSYLGTLSTSIKKLNATLPVENVARLLGITADEARTVINMISEQGIVDDDSLKALVSDPDRMVSECGLDGKFAARLARTARRANMKTLLSVYDIPIKDVQSLANVDYIEGEGDKFTVTKLLDSEKIDEASIGQMKKRVAGWDVYKDALVSGDGKLAGVLVQLNVFEKNVRTSVLKGIRKLVEQEKPAGVKIFISGEPVIVDSISDFIIHDMALLIPLVVIIVILVLLFTFRNFEGIFYPSLAVVLSCLWALGTMSFCNVPINMISTILPVLLVAMGSAYGLHFMNSYFLHRSDDKLLVVRDNLVDIGISITMSAMAMVAGFGSLATNEFVPIRNFGIFTAIGVVYAFLISLYVIPSLMLLSKRKKFHFFTDDGKMKDDLLYRFLSWIDGFTKKNSKPILVLSLIVVVVCFFGIKMMKVDMNTVGFFKKNTVIRQADDILNRDLAGTGGLTVVLESTDGQDIVTPEVLTLLDSFEKDIKAKYPSIRKVISPGTYLKKMNREMHGGNPAFDRVPDEMAQISDYLLLYSGNLSSVMTKNHQGVRTALSMKRIGTSSLKGMKVYVENWFKPYLEKNPGMKMSITGIASVEIVINDMITKGQLSSILLSAIAVFLINLLVFRSVGVTLISLIPMFVGLAINFGVMGFIGIPLNAGTAMISAVAIGVGVDYAIHFIIRYRVAWRRERNLNAALLDALTIRGRGIVYNVAAVMMGFLVLVFSGFIPIIQFGVFIAVNMVATGFGALFIIPAALRVFGRKKPFFTDDKIDINTVPGAIS